MIFNAYIRPSLGTIIYQSKIIWLGRRLRPDACVAPLLPGDAFWNKASVSERPCEAVSRDPYSQVIRYEASARVFSTSAWAEASKALNCVFISRARCGNFFLRSAHKLEEKCHVFPPGLSSST